MGRPQFEVVVASAPREELQIFDFEQNVSVIANTGRYMIDLFAPPGFIGELKSLWLQAQAPTSYGGTYGGVGTNVHTFGLSDNEDKIIYTQANNTADKMLDFQQNHWETYGWSNPTSEEGVIMTLDSVAFDDTTGLRLSYYNNTPSNITNTPLRMRAIYVLRQVSGVS